MDELNLGLLALFGGLVAVLTKLVDVIWRLVSGKLGNGPAKREPGCPMTQSPAFANHLRDFDRLAVGIENHDKTLTRIESNTAKCGDTMTTVAAILDERLPRGPR